jgi:hypothetical protein
MPTFRRNILPLFWCFNPEDGDNIFLRNVGTRLQEIHCVTTQKTTIWTIIELKILNHKFLARKLNTAIRVSQLNQVHTFTRVFLTVTLIPPYILTYPTSDPYNEFYRTKIYVPLVPHIHVTRSSNITHRLAINSYISGQTRRHIFMNCNIPSRTRTRTSLSTSIFSLQRVGFPLIDCSARNYTPLTPYHSPVKTQICILRKQCLHTNVGVNRSLKVYNSSRSNSCLHIIVVFVFMSLCILLDQWLSKWGTRTPWGYAVRAQKSLDIVTKSLSWQHCHRLISENWVTKRGAVVHVCTRLSILPPHFIPIVLL